MENFIFYAVIFDRVLNPPLRSFTKHLLGTLVHDKLGVVILRKKCLYSELFWSVFSRIRTDYGEIWISLRIQSECGKISSRITPNTDSFYAVLLMSCIMSLPTNDSKILNKPNIIFFIDSHLCTVVVDKISSIHCVSKRSICCL